MVAACAGAWIALLIASPTEGELPEVQVERPAHDDLEGPFSIIADQLEGEPSRGVYRARGNVVVTRPGHVIYADAITFDETRKQVTAEGRVTIVDSKSVLICRRASMILPELTGGLAEVELRIKSEIPEDVRAALGPAEILRYDEDELILTARNAARLDERTFEVSGGSFTACDCRGGEEPSWKIRAYGASVDLDAGAWLELPVFYWKGAPVLALPAFYVPLGSRRSGLLAPRVSGIGNSVTGVQLTQPLYLAPDESWDATLEGGFLFARGPSASLELRWAPAIDHEGRVQANVILDYGTFDPVSQAFERGRERPLARFAIAAEEEASFEGARVAGDVNLIGDPAYVAEFSHAFLDRQAESTLSRVVVSGVSGSSVRVAGGLSLLQDLRQGRYRVPEPSSGVFAAPELRDVALFSGTVPGPGGIRYRFADLRLDAPPHPLLAGDGPLLGEARLLVSLFAAPSPEIARFARVDLRPSLALPVRIGGFAVLEPSLAVRFSGWAGHADGRDVSAGRFGAVLKASLFTEVGRSFEDLVHRIRPEVTYLLIPLVERRGGATFETRDEIDLLGVASQVAFRIQTELYEAGTGRRLAGLEGRIGRDLDPPGSDSGLGTSELLLKADVTLDPFGPLFRLALESRAAFDPTRKVLTEILAGLRGVTSDGDALSILYGDFGESVPLHTFIASEELVPSRTLPNDGYVPLSALEDRLAAGDVDGVPWSPYRGVTISASTHPWPLRHVPFLGEGRLTLGFDVGLSFDRREALEAAGRQSSIVRNTRTLARWDSGCDCWGAGVVVTTERSRPRSDIGLPGFSAQVIFDLARLGEVVSP